MGSRNNLVRLATGNRSEAEAFIQARDESDSEEFQENIAGWSIERDADLELESFADSTSTGMLFTDFVEEWSETVGRAPTQEEYENWIQLGTQGQIHAELRDGSTFQQNIAFDDVFSRPDNEDGTPGAPLEGAFDVYGAADLEGLTGPFDMMNDEEFVIVPDGTEMADRYVMVNEELFEGTDAAMYVKAEREDWYENEVMSGVISLAAGMVTSAIVSYVPYVGGALSGAAGGAVSAGVSASIQGGDFWDAAGEGAVYGAATQGLGSLSNLFSSTASQAAVRGLGNAGIQIARGEDVEDAALTGVLSASSFAIGEEYGLTEQLVFDAGVGFALDGSEGAVSNILSDAAGVGRQALSRQDTEESTD